MLFTSLVAALQSLITMSHKPPYFYPPLLDGSDHITCLIQISLNSYKQIGKFNFK